MRFCTEVRLKIGKSSGMLKHFAVFFALYRENILILFNICDIILYCLEFNGLFIRKFVLRRFIK